MARRYCRAHGIRFTTSFHTRFPEYLNQRFAIPTGWTAAVLRRFHNAGAGLMVATPSLGRELEAARLRTRAAVDARRRHRRCSARAPCGCSAMAPVFLYVGRIAAEKSIADVPRPRPSRPQGRRRRRPAARRADGEISGRAVHRQEDRRGAGRVLRLGRRVRLPQPHRHVRHGAAGSDGVGLAGRGAARVRAAGRGDANGVTGVLSHDLRAAALAALVARSRARARQGGGVQLGECGAAVPRQHHRRLPQRPGAGACRAASCRWPRPSRPPQARV